MGINRILRRKLPYILVLMFMINISATFVDLGETLDNILNEKLIIEFGSSKSKTDEKANINNESSLDPSDFYRKEYFNVPSLPTDDYTRRKNITVDHTKVSGSLTDFPLLIELIDGDLKDYAKSDGSDIVFMDDQENILDFEIELYDPNYDPINAHLVAWVKTDLSSIQDTIISMYYGSLTATSQANPTGVWSNNFESTWHLGETVTDETSSGTHYDSTINDYDGNQNGNDDTSALIGNGQDFDGNDDTSISSTLNLNPTGDVTISGWFKLDTAFDSLTANSMFIAGKYSSDTTNFHIGLTGGNYGSISDLGSFVMKIENSDVRSYKWTNQVSWNAENWYYYSCVIDSTDSLNNKIYINGVDDTSSSDYGTYTSLDLSFSSSWGIGGGGSDSYNFGGSFSWFTGVLDEIRISNGIRTQNWITTSYNNQINPASFLSLGGEEIVHNNWVDYDFKFRKNITIDYTLVSSNLIDFPLMLDLYDADLQDYAQTDGDDIKFIDSNGIKLDHEIELYNPNYSSIASHLTVWVKIDLSNTTDTIITMYYGNSTISNQENPTAVWSGDYAGIWHLSDNPTGTIYDSTDNNNDGTTYGSMTLSDSITGNIGYALELDGSNDYIAVPNSPTLDITGNKITMSAWIYLPSLPHPVDAAIMNKAASTNEPNYMLGVDGTSNPTLLNHRVYTTGGFTRKDTGEIYEGDWTYVTAVYDGTLTSNPRFFAYIDGVLVSSNSAGPGNLLSSTVDLLIGRRPDERMLNAWIDELRISTEAKSTDYILTCYNNQETPELFYSIGNEERFDDYPFYDKSLYNYQEDYLDSVTEFQSPTDIGTYSDWTNMQDIRSVSATLSEGESTTLDSGWNSPSASTDSGWTDNAGFYSSDNYRASCQGGLNPDTASIYNFNIPSIPTYAVAVVGIELSIECHYVDSNDYFESQLLYDSRVSSTSSKSVAITSTQDTITTVGSSTDTWGRTWDFTDFSNTNFGVGLTSKADTTSDFTYVDHIQVIIYYSVYEFDREFSFNSTGLYDQDYELCISTNTLGTESLNVDMWDTVNTEWTTILVLEDSYDNEWKNITISDILFKELPLRFRFKDTNSTDNVQNSWEIDGIILKYKQTAKKFYYEKDITIDYTKVNGILNDYPLLLEIDDEQLHSDVQISGNDIIFTDSNNNRLAHEIESFDQTGNGTHAKLITWIKIPTLSNIADTTIKMFFGNDHINSQEIPEEVWSSDFLTVHHLDDDPSGIIYDSTQNDLDLISSGSMTSDDVLSVVIGDGIDFDGSDDGLTSSNSISLIGDFSYSLWFELDSAGMGNWKSLINIDSGTSNYLFLGINDANSLALQTSTTTLTFGTISADILYNLILTYNSTSNNFKAYINGTQFGSTQTLTLSSYTDDFQIGAWGSSDNIDGRIDEVRVIDECYDLMWIQTEYTNQKNPSNFLTIGITTNVADMDPPTVINLGITDRGDDTPEFWALMDDDVSGVSSVTLRINSTNYSMSYNGSFWTYQTSSIIYGGYYTYQIINATDNLGRYLATASGVESYTFTYDTINPQVDDWDYSDDLADPSDHSVYGTFIANVSDTWGDIDTVVLNITQIGSIHYNNITAVMREISPGNYINNSLSLVIGEYVYFQIIVNDTAGNSKTSAIRNRYVTYNHLPEASNINISPLDPLGNGSLTLSYDFFDFNGDLQSGTVIDWYKNGQKVIPLSGSLITTVSSDYLDKGDKWNATVIPSDNRGAEGFIYWSSQTVTVQNILPEVSSCLITNGNTGTLSELTGDYIFYDYDGDLENVGAVEINWYRNRSGTVEVVLSNNLILDDSYSQKNDIFWIQVRVNDGDGYSIWLESAKISIINTIPTASTLTLTSSPYTTTDLVASWSYDDADSDSQSSNWRVIWYRNGVPFLENTTIIGFGNTSKGQIWTFKLYVHDGFEFSIEYNLGTGIEILNSVPVASDLTITIDPYTNETIIAGYSDDDDDGDSMTISELHWYRNGTLMSAYDSLLSLQSSTTTKHDEWHFSLILSDGESTSIEVNSTITIVQNSLPTATSLSITSLPKTETNIVASWIFSDEDSLDVETSYLIMWYYINGTHIDGYDDSDILPFTTFSKNDVIYYTLQVSDGEGISILYTSTSTTVINTAPTASNLTITISPTTTTDLNASWSYDDADDDTESVLYQIIWYLNGEEQIIQENSTIIDSSNTKKGQRWKFSIKVYDGYEYSILYSMSGSIEILNTIPIVGNLTITDQPNTLNNIVSGWDQFDPDVNDGIDTLTISAILWYRNGTYMPSYDGLTTLPSSTTSKNYEWHYSIEIYDGTNTSILVNSPTTFVINSIPTASSLTATDSPRSNEDVEAFWTYDDVDGDAESQNWLIIWYINNVHSVSLDNSKIIGSGNISREDELYYVLQVFDGYNFSIIYSLSVNITVGNAIPTVLSPTFTNTVGVTQDDDLVTDYTFYDADSGDIENNKTIIWYQNGVYNSTFDDMTTISSIYTADGENYYYKITVNDGIENSITYSSAIVLINFLNHAPSVSNLILNATLITNVTILDLQIWYDFFDLDGHPSSGTEIQWYNSTDGSNWTIMSDAFGYLVLPSSLTTKNTYYKFGIHPSDGLNFGSWVNSTIIFIINSIPEVTSALITTIAYTTTELFATWTSEDDDSTDNLDSDYIIQWYLDGNLQAIYTGNTTLPNTATTKGQYWHYSISVWDSEIYSPTVNSSTVLILNSKPIAGNLTLPVDPVTTVDLNASWDYYDADNDGESANWRVIWYKNGIPFIENTTIIGAGNTSKGQVWTFRVYVHDGTEFSLEFSYGTGIEISNSVPLVQNTNITLNPFTIDEIVAEWTGHDDDIADNLDNGYILLWYRDLVYMSLYDNIINLPTTATTKGESWHFSITLYDSEAYSITVNSTATLILNSAPIAYDLIITQNPTTTSDLEASWSYSDSDNDIEVSNWRIRWYNNSVEVPLLENQTIVGFGNTVKGQYWYYILQVYDGFAFSTVYNSSDILFNAGVLIKNAIPTASDLIITINPFTDENLTISWTFHDDDGESEVVYIVSWFMNGENQTELINLLEVPSSITNKSQRWRYQLLVSDGYNYSQIYTSPATDIINSQPVIDDVSITNSPYTTTNLQASWNGHDIDNDIISTGFIIYWFKDGINVPTYDNLATLPSSATLKHEFWHYQLYIYDGSSFSIAMNSSTIEIQNSAPQVTFANVLDSLDDLTTLSILYVYNETADADADQIAAHNITWYKVPSEDLGLLNNATTVPNSYTTKGDVWYFKISVYDGESWSLEVQSLNIMIVNSLPVVGNVTIIGGSSTNDPVSVDYDYYDADNDTEVITSESIEWARIRGGSYSTFPLSILTVDYILAGDLIFCIITPNDGDDEGDSFSTLQDANYYITIGNSQPELTFGPMIVGADGNNESYDVILSLYIYYNATDRDGNDISDGPYDISWSSIDSSNATFWVVSDSEYEWYKNGFKTSQKGPSLDSSYLVRGDTWVVRMRIRDRYGDYSEWYNSSAITIGNSRPKITGISWNMNNPTTEDNLQLDMQGQTFFIDANGDLVSLSIIRWFVTYTNGSTIEITEFENNYQISSLYYSKGDRIFVVITPYDGINNGLEYNSSLLTGGIVTVINAIPEISNVQLNDNLNYIYINDALQLSFNYFDPDNDSMFSYDIKWYINGIHRSDYDDDLIISSSNTISGQNWFVEIIVNDGQDNSIMYQTFTFSIYTINIIINDDNDFILENEDISIFYYLTVDYLLYGTNFNDTYSTYRWYRNDELTLFTGQSIPLEETHPGDTWRVELIPYDNENSFEGPLISNEIFIESLPVINTFDIEIQVGIDQVEGQYIVWINATDYLTANETYSDERSLTVQFLITLDELDITLPIQYVTNPTNENLWIIELDFLDILTRNGYSESDFISILGTNITVQTSVVKVVTFDSTDYNIQVNGEFKFIIEDKTAPRIVYADFFWNDDFKPTSITFYANIEDFGTGVDEVTLLYFFRSIGDVNETNGDDLSNLIRFSSLSIYQSGINWSTVTMVWNATTSRYEAMIDFTPKENYEVLFNIQVSDLSGNVNLDAYPDGTSEERVRNGRFLYAITEGLPIELILIAILFLIIVSAVAIRKFSKTELVGLDIDVVMKGLDDIPKEEIIQSLDEHTLGVIVSFFDQRHGPIPIITDPPILKDNFNKLVELSDLSFSACRFADKGNYVDELPSSFDFIIGEGLRTTSVSFGFALERPQARGGAENLTINILVHKKHSNLITQFIDQLMLIAHEAHILMDKEPEKKDIINKKVISLRHMVSNIVMSYEKQYGHPYEEGYEEVEEY